MSDPNQSVLKSELCYPNVCPVLQSWAPDGSCCLCWLGAAGPAGHGRLLIRDDGEGRRACSRCPLCSQVAGVQHTSEYLISGSEHVSVHLTCAHPIFTVS